MKIAVACILALLAQDALADSVVPLRTLRAGTVITAEDLRLDAKTLPGTFGAVEDVIGQEAKVSLYAGRPVRHGEIGPPALIERNQVVPLVFEQFGLRISTEGRALARGSVGDVVRVMNLSSKATLFGEIQIDGSIQVTN